MEKQHQKLVEKYVKVLKKYDDYEAGVAITQFDLDYPARRQILEQARSVPEKFVLEVTQSFSSAAYHSETSMSLKDWEKDGLHTGGNMPPALIGKALANFVVGVEGIASVNFPDQRSDEIIKWVKALEYEIPKIGFKTAPMADFVKESMSKKLGANKLALLGEIAAILQ